MIVNFAPVLIPTLNRYDHLKKCIESLSKNKYAHETHLFIALDAPLKESHVDGYNKSKDFLTTISSFKEITVFVRESNLGAKKNLDLARKEIFKLYDRIIVSEDDNYFSENFLEYINLGLENFKDSENVYAICGYNYPISIPKNYYANFYFWKGFSAWGYGVWREKFRDSFYSIDDINDYLKKPSNAYQLGKYASHYLTSLLDIVKKNYMTGDTAICMHLIKNNMYCVFPTHSKVRNLGHDGSGIHCGKSDVFSKQLIDENYSFEYFFSSIEYEDKEIYKVLKVYFDNDWKSKTKTFIKYLLFLIGIRY